jgi:ABC-type nitrate/sulfonate/bicarbonate transport system ATPase subunit
MYETNTQVEGVVSILPGGVVGDAHHPVPIAVSVREVSKAFPHARGRIEALRRVSFEVPAGSFVTFVGPSGSGKSTLLGILAGLDEPDSGTVKLTPEGSGAALEARLGHVGYMPQRDLLLPWLNALDNAAVGLEVAGASKEAAHSISMSLLEEFGLSGFAASYPYQLSGGMRQRVSFLRSALLSRGLMLLDEPFGALDALTRGTMQEWLRETSGRISSTYILVTHDVDEAVLLSDRVYVLSPRPGTVVGVIEIDLPGPRDAGISGHPRFSELRRELLDMLKAAGATSDVGGR